MASITELARALAERAISAVELTRLYLDRMQRYAELNAYIETTPERALAQAEAADREIAKSGHRDLLGIPIAHKDIFCVDGIRTTCASRMLENFVAPYDATVTRKLFHEAGAVMLGKANMDEFAMGASNETSYFGPVQNPWNARHVPGGSSGGSAAAVAAGLCAGATGTDTGGSIRLPSAFCGISGIKPTYGRVSRYGMVAFASSLDQGGPMARSAADLRLMLRAMEGHDAHDSTSMDVEPTALEAEAKPLRIGIPEEFWRELGADMTEPLEAARKVFEGLGHAFETMSLPNGPVAIPAYYVLSSAEASTNLSRYDGVRFGHRAADAGDVESLIERSRTEGFGGEVKRRILTGTYALSVGYYDAYYDKAQRLRRLIRQDFLTAFERFDAILAPVSASPAFACRAFREKTDMYRQDRFTVPANLAGLPALSIPCGFVDGLPVGLQLIAPHFHENRLLSLGEAYQRETDWHRQHPEMD